MFDLIAFCLFSGLIAFTAGVYSRTTGISFGLILTLGLYSIKSFLPDVFLPIALPVFLATSLATTFVLSLGYLIQTNITIRNNLVINTKAQETNSLLAVLGYAVITTMIVAQLIGIIDSHYLSIVFLSFLTLYLMYFIWPHWVKRHYANLPLPITIKYLLANVVGICTGNQGREFTELLEPLNSRSAQSNSNIKTGLLTKQSGVEVFDKEGITGVLICLAACCSFALPALPETLTLLTDNLGYIYVPSVIYLSVIGFLGMLLVRHHKNDTDIVWLRRMFSVFLGAILLRESWMWLV